ncbi:MAG: DNA-3-methyladenine glycosylase 2 family protein [Sulfobacillus sp.]
MLDHDICYRAVQSRDARFDGMFFTAVRTTGIYCRPSCGARTPLRDHVHFYSTAAAAQQAGYRACKRCRPDATPNSPEWNSRADVVGRAMRLIADGVVDREGVAGLAERLSYSPRQVNRQLLAVLGAGPQALGRAQRSRTARILLETTDRPMSDVAFAAGFRSVRQFNETMRSVYALTPSAVRARVRTRTTAPPDPNGDVIRLRLPYRPPLDFQGLLNFLAARAVPGVEECSCDTYRRVLSLPHQLAVVSLQAPQRSGQTTPSARSPYIECAIRLQDLRDLTAAVQRCRRLLDLDSDPQAVAAVLMGDARLAPLVAANPGRRVPGHVDEHELAVRAVLGQQVSIAAARSLAGKLAARYGEALPFADGTLTHAFPTAAALAAAAPLELAMPRARQRALGALIAALADGRIRLDAGADRDAVSAQLEALPGIGPWTVAYIRMRSLSDPDAFLATDLGLRQAMAKLGLPTARKEVLALAEDWRPWRAYAQQYLWALTGTGLAPRSPARART